MDWNGWMIAGGIALILGAAVLMARWLLRYARRAYQARLREIDRIVNQEQVPQDWLRPYLSQIVRLQDGKGTDVQIPQLTEIARKRCLANIRELIRYVERANVTRSEAANAHLLDSLREQEARWQSEAWEAQLMDEIKRWQRERE